MYVLLLEHRKNTFWEGISRVGRAHTPSKCSSADAARMELFHVVKAGCFHLFVFVHQVSSEKHLMAINIKEVAFAFVLPGNQQQLLLSIGHITCIQPFGCPHSSSQDDLTWPLTGTVSSPSFDKSSHPFSLWDLSWSASRPDSLDTQRFVALQPEISVSVPQYLVLPVLNLPQKSRSSRLDSGSTGGPFSVPYLP